MDIEQRLRHLDEGQVEILHRLDDITETVRDTVIELGGVPSLGRDPSRRSIRARLHDLEADRSAARAAATALDAARALHAASREKRFSRREKIASLILAALLAVGPYIAALLIHPS